MVTVLLSLNRLSILLIFSDEEFFENSFLINGNEIWGFYFNKINYYDLK